MTDQVGASIADAIQHFSLECLPGTGDHVADNRRSSTRHEVSLPCKVTVDGTAKDATMVNLSLGGALVEAGQKFPMGARVQVAFNIPRYEDLIDIGATVRWSDAKAVGLQFDGLRARDVWALNEFFKLLSS